MNLSPRNPNVFGSKNSEWKNRKIKNVPPPISKIGADNSTASCTFGSELKAAVTTPAGPSDGLVIQTIAKGNRPLSKKTAIKRPQTKNHRLAFSDMVDKTWALITALSIEETVSNNTSPITIKMMEKTSMIPLLYSMVAEK